MVPHEAENGVSGGLLTPPSPPQKWCGVEQRLGAVGAVQSLMVTMLGTGIVAFPYAFALCGYVVGPLILLLMGALAYLSYVSLVRVTVKAYATSYGSLLHAIPAGWRYYTNVALWVLLIFVMTSYTLIAADIIRSFVGAMSPKAKGCAVLQNYPLFGIIIAVVFPFSLLNSLHGLRGISTYCSCAILITVVLLVWEACFSLSKAHPEGNLAMTAGSFQAPLAVPIFGCAMFGHMNVSQIYAELRPGLKARAPLLSGMACLGVILLYLAVGASGYAAFGSGATTDIVSQIASRDGRRGTVVALQAFLGSYIVLKLPLFVLPLRNLSLEILDPGIDPAAVSATRRAGLTLVLLGCVYLVTILIPDLSKILELSGTLIIIPLTFIVPARLSWTLEEPRPTARCLLLLIAGLVTLVMSLGVLVNG